MNVAVGATRVNHIDASTVAAMADDLLAKIDFIIAIDTSGSTDDPSTRYPGQNLLGEMKENTIALARQANRHDTDGLTVIRFGGNHVNFADGVTPDAVANVFKEYRPMGGTPTEQAIDMAIQKTQASEKEAVLVLVMTDGKPNNNDEVVRHLQIASRTFGQPTTSGLRSKIGFVFVQVGENAEAAQWLETLNEGLGAGYTDIVAVCTSQDLEDLTIEQLATLAFTA